MEQYEQLFKAVSQIVQQAKVAKEESRLRGEQFNIFKVCGIDHYELQHSAIIAELLNPQGSHGQGSSYLKLFMETYDSSINVSTLDEKSIQVKREEWTTDYDGRMDICVEYLGKPIVIIENKLYARDQSIQLQRYDKDAQQRKADKYDIVYLTLDGKDATDDSAGDVNYYRMSYAKDIIKWLDMCIMHSAGIPLVRETLIQYKHHIKQLTHQDMDNSIKEQMYELLLNNPKETEMIVNAVNDSSFCDYLFERKIIPRIKEAFGKEYSLDFSDMPNGFYIFKESWEKNGMYVYFGDENKNACGKKWVGIYASKKKVPQKELDSLQGDKSSDWWPFGTQYLPEGMDYWYSPNFITNVANGSFVGFVVKKMDEITSELNSRGVALECI